ncbi:unnamed protein product, partial [Polarella glacialis]
VRCGHGRWQTLLRPGRAGALAPGLAAAKEGAESDQLLFQTGIPARHGECLHGVCRLAWLLGLCSPGGGAVAQRQRGGPASAFRGRRGGNALAWLLLVATCTLWAIAIEVPATQRITGFLGRPSRVTVSRSYLAPVLEAIQEPSLGMAGPESGAASGRFGHLAPGRVRVARAAQPRH